MSPIRHLLLPLFLLPSFATAGDLAPTGAFVPPGAAMLAGLLEAATGGAAPRAGLLTGIEAVDTPAGTGWEAAGIVYHSEVLAAPVALLREAASLGAQSTGGAGSFRRWLGSEEAERLTMEARLGSSFSTPAEPRGPGDTEETPFPLLFAGAGLGMASCLLRIGGTRRRRRA
ncbi:MAG: hypothetical protein IT163_13845 [Bryobacterales bacterium]|nr:hypothetical protein [Bryobacterales bacterium]